MKKSKKRRPTHAWSINKKKHVIEIICVALDFLLSLRVIVFLGVGQEIQMLYPVLV